MSEKSVWLAAYTHDSDEVEHHYDLRVTKDGGLHVTHRREPSRSIRDDFPLIAHQNRHEPMIRGRRISVLDIVESGYSADEIATKLDVDIEAVEQAIKYADDKPRVIDRLRAEKERFERDFYSETE